MALSAPKSSSTIDMEVVSKRYEDSTTSTPLSSIVEALEEIAMFLKNKSSEEQLRLDTFCHSCSLISILFGCLGLAFKFAELEYISKVTFFFPPFTHYFFCFYFILLNSITKCFVFNSLYAMYTIKNNIFLSMFKNMLHFF